MTSLGDPLSRFVALGTGLRYHVLEWGADAPQDHTVVLLHGFLDFAWGWVPMMRAWRAAGLHVVAPDLRGHGDSGRVGRGGYYHFLDYVADVEDLIAQIARGRVSLVGHSMGGSVAAYYAGSFPDRVHRIALLEGLGPPEQSDTAAERVRPWIDAWRASRSRPLRTYATVEEAAARLRAHDSLLSHELSLALAAEGTRPTPEGRLAFKHDPMHATPGPLPYRVDQAAGFWSRIRSPVLVVEGDQSNFRFMADEAARRMTFFSDVRRVTLAGAAHMMQRHQPAALAQMLGDFLLAEQVS